MRKVPGVNTHIFKQPNIPWGSGFSAEATAAFALYDSLGDGLTAAEKTVMAAYIDAEVANGNHTKKDYETIYSLSGNNALVDYIGGKVATAVNAPTHSVNGYTFDGATNYIDSNWNPTDDGVKFTQNNGSVGAFVFDTGVGSMIYGALGTGSINIYHLITGPMVFNVSAGGVVSAITNKSLFVGDRKGATEINIYKDGVNVDSNGVASAGNLNKDIFIGGRNNSGLTNASSSTISSFIAAAAVGFNQSDYNTNLRTLLTGLGVTL
jgi:hypothetical protein